MFVKKDLRKIPVIMNDAMKTMNNGTNAENDNDINNNNSNNNNGPSLTELRLARRPTEFKDGLKNVLCQPRYIPALSNLISLSLYDCSISNLDGIGFFASSPITTYDEEKMDIDNGSSSNNVNEETIVCPNLEELNLGRNPLKTLPDELGSLSTSLKSLWLDDCEIEGSLPDCLYQLDKLEMLRISNNRITELNDGVGRWKHMKILCLDGNEIHTLPKVFTELTNLKSLLVRNNKLTSLPEGVPGKSHQQLELLHISSNQLKALPDSLRECVMLKTFYANGNQIKEISAYLFGMMSELSTCNLSNNKISVLPEDFIDRFGQPEGMSGTCSKVPDCKIFLEQNPVLDKN